MTDSALPGYGQRTMSWQSAWHSMSQADSGQPHDDDAARRMHELRGTIITQAAETEAVLRIVVGYLDPAVDTTRRTAGWLLGALRRLLPARDLASWTLQIHAIHDATTRRNRAVHSTVEIGSTWTPYATGGGEWTAVISLMNGEEYGESDLMADLAAQHEATLAALTIMQSVAQLDRVEPIG